MPTVDPIYDFMRTGQYPQYRAFNPGAGLADLLRMPGVPQPPVASPDTLAQLLTPGSQDAPGGQLAGNQSQLIDAILKGPQSKWRLDGGQVTTMPPTPTPDHRKHSSTGPQSPIDALLAQLFGGGFEQGGGSNPVADEISKQIGLLQQTAGASKKDLLKHEQRARQDLKVLYNHLGRFVKRSGRQNRADYRQDLHLLNHDYEKNVADTRKAFGEATNAANSEAERLGLTADTSGITAERIASVEQSMGTRRDLRADLKADHRNEKQLNRQMREDAKMERNVQIGQVHRDTTQALSDLSNTLQAQLGQLRMARASATASGASPLDVLSQEADLAKKLLDIKAAQQELQGKSSGKTGGDAGKGFQDALTYLAEQKRGNALQGVLQGAENTGTRMSEAGSGTDLSTQPFFWRPDDRNRIMSWMKSQLTARGITPTEQIMNELARALRINWGLD